MAQLKGFEGRTEASQEYILPMQSSFNQAWEPQGAHPDGLPAEIRLTLPDLLNYRSLFLVITLLLSALYWLCFSDWTLIGTIIKHQLGLPATIEWYISFKLTHRHVGIYSSMDYHVVDAQQMF